MHPIWESTNQIFFEFYTSCELINNSFFPDETTKKKVWKKEREEEERKENPKQVIPFIRNTTSCQKKKSANKTSPG